MTLASTVLFGLSAVALGLAADTPAVVYAAVAAWGLAFGGVPTLFQAALANTAGEAADVAQSMLVTAWNLAIAGGGVAGGLLLAQFGVWAFPPAVLALLLVTLLVVGLAKRNGFPASLGQAISVAHPPSPAHPTPTR